jgi:tetratricopeptide (TPR) repeat protein
MLRKLTDSLKNSIFGSSQKGVSLQQRTVEKSSQDVDQEALTDSLKQKFSFVGETINTVKNEMMAAKEKSKNLRQANYELGMKHLEKGNISEALFRFRITTKFWPDLLDAQYQFAYCLALKNKASQAKEVLQKLLEKKPDFQQARELLNVINQVESN